MKRPSIAIGKKPASPERVRAEVSKASASWLQERRGTKAAPAKRRHRALDQAAKEAKALATAHAKRKREAEREARELEKLLTRIGYLSRRSAREAEAMLRVQVSWKRSSEPKVTSVCPRKLYSRLHPEISARTVGAMTRSRIAADGFKNVVLRKIPRGYGRKAERTRPYRDGEAADLARYIIREEALETGIASVFSNIIGIDGEPTLAESEELRIDVQRCARIVGFWDALEAFEAEADPDGNVYSHLIMAMPHELSPEGRSKALEDICFRLDALNLPFVAALHRPDDNGDVRNFHAHIIMAPRPFAVEGPFAWSFEAGKATELNLPAGIGWLRQQTAEAFNHALALEKNPLRYSGLSQAQRGVPSTGELHDGPALTARKRKAQEDKAERDRLVRGMAAHVASGLRHQTDLGARIDAQAARQLAHVPAPVSEASSPLEKLRRKFPDPAKLQGLSVADFIDFTAADRAADKWFGPALGLVFELRRGSGSGLARDRNGEPELVKEALAPEYLPLLDAPELPDIVQEALQEAHRHIVAERERELRVRREKERVRKERMRWLRGAPVLLFDDRGKLLPQYQRHFPPEVLELEGIREAMRECHDAAEKQQRATTASLTLEAEEESPSFRARESEPAAPGAIANKPNAAVEPPEDHTHAVDQATNRPPEERLGGDNAGDDAPRAAEADDHRQGAAGDNKAREDAEWLRILEANQERMRNSRGGR